MYANGRKQLRRKLFEIGVIAHLDMNLLLVTKHNGEYKPEGEINHFRARDNCRRNQTFPTLNLN